MPLCARCGENIIGPARFRGAPEHLECPRTDVHTLDSFARERASAGYLAVGSDVLHDIFGMGTVTGRRRTAEQSRYFVRFVRDGHERLMLGISLKPSAIQTEKPPAIDAAPGDRVLHQSLGDGVVVETRVEGRARTVCVRFARDRYRWLDGMRLVIMRRRNERLPDATVDSVLERRLLHLIRLGGFSDPVGQYRIPFDGTEYFLDFAYPSAKIGIEADGRTHNRDESHRHDAERDQRLASIGWRVERFSGATIRRRREVVLSRLEALGLPRSSAGTRRGQSPPYTPAYRRISRRPAWQFADHDLAELTTTEYLPEATPELSEDREIDWNHVDPDDEWAWTHYSSRE